MDSGSGSLFQQCQALLEQLRTIPDFDNSYLKPVADAIQRSNNTTPDPVTLLWNTLRQGGALCHLINMIRPGAVDAAQIILPGSNTSGGQDLVMLFRNNKCKQNVYYFLNACRQSLGDDDIFQLTELFQDDTNGLVKVLRVVEKLLKVLESSNRIPRAASSRTGSAYGSMQLAGGAAAIAGRSSSTYSSGLGHRAKVVIELLETERSYVRSLEGLQNYKQQIEHHQLLDAQTIGNIFSNIDALVDFQRRFLIAMETALQAPEEDQHIGLVFTKMDSGFHVYEPFCANHQVANDLVMNEKTSLSKLDNSMGVDVTRELFSLLIKPVQRICRYPLLLTELLKVTPDSSSDYPELQAAIAVAKGIADRVNEHKRQQENGIAVEDLMKRVDDWNSLSPDQFGQLLLTEKLLVGNREADKELQVYLFERILLMFKEASNRLSLKRKSRTGLNLKGNIFIRSIDKVVVRDNESIKLFWSEESTDSFILKFRSEDMLKKWYSELDRLISSAQRRHSGRQMVGHNRRPSLSAASAAQSRQELFNQNEAQQAPQQVVQQQLPPQQMSRQRSVGSLGNEDGRPSQLRLSNSSSAQSLHQTPDELNASYERMRRGNSGLSNSHSREGLSVAHDELSRGRARSQPTSSQEFYNGDLPPLPNTAPIPQQQRSSAGMQKTRNSSENEQSASNQPIMSPSSLKRSAQRSRDPSQPPQIIQQRSSSHSRQPSTGTSTAANSLAQLLDETKLDSQQSNSGPSSRTRLEERFDALFQEAEFFSDAPTPPPLKDHSRNASIEVEKQKSLQRGSSNVDSGNAPLPPPLNRNAGGSSRSISTNQQQTTPPASTAGQRKIKFRYNDEIHVIYFSPTHSTPFLHLKERVLSKLQLLVQPSDDLSAVRLRYQDDDGDFIVMNCDDDVRLACQSRPGTLTLFVNLLNGA